MVIILLGTHLFLTVRLRFPQRKLFKAIRLSVQSDKSGQGDVSQFGALATALAATIGTGNIVGVATAITLGGPGAVFWCWLTGVLGISTKYAEGLLAVKYRIRTPQGKMLGGPMYALERGMGMKWLAVLFCIFTVCASFGIGNLVQSNAISMLCYETYRVPQALTGTAVAVCVALVVIFGVKGIARVCSAFVPLMAALYFLGCCYILWVNGGYVWDAVKLIVESAFRPEAAGGGFVGGSVIMTARYGIARGLFSNESGMGSAPIVAAAAQTRNPVRQALVSSTGTFWDTVVICALTGLVLVSSILAYPDISIRRRTGSDQSGFRQDSLSGRSPAHVRHRHFCFLHNLRMVLLRRKGYGIPERQTVDLSLPGRLYRRRILRCHYAVGRGVELCRPDQCPHGSAEHRIPDRTFGHCCRRDPKIPVGRPSGRRSRSGRQPDVERPGTRTLQINPVWRKASATPDFLTGIPYSRVNPSRYCSTSQPFPR